MSKRQAFVFVITAVRAVILMRTKHSLIDELKSQGVLDNRGIARAFEAVDRAYFVLPKHSDSTYENHPLPIGFGQTISQPYTVAFMLNLLNVRAGEKILEIGAGSGWATALLCHLTGKTGRVIALERIPQLANMTKENLAKYPMCERAAEVIKADGNHGWPAAEPFDKIIAAAAAQEIPRAWKEQLKIGGRIVAPVKDCIMAVDKTGADEYRIVEHWGFAFVPLVKESSKQN